MQHEGVTTRPTGTAVFISIFLILGLAAPAVAGVTIRTAQDVLDHHTTWHGDRLFVVGPDGSRWELVTDIEDPVIRNRGAGEFFPVDPAHVQTALDALTYPLEGIQVDIFILPFPRRALLPSSAENHVIYLSPGVMPVANSKVHSVLAHEMGHVVHRTYLPDHDEDAWEAYRTLRGIENTSIYHGNAAHRDRPREIFAEDFRVLFGGALANYSGTIENQAILFPTAVSGLETFMRSLAEPSLVGTVRQLRVYPNPTRADVHLALAGEPGFPEAGLVVLSVFDVQGRLVARKGLAGDYRWDGRLENGSSAPPGLYFLRAVRGGQVWIGKILVQP
jgi:hypothetical protein